MSENSPVEAVHPRRLQSALPKPLKINIGTNSKPSKRKDSNVNNRKRSKSESSSGTFHNKKHKKGT